MFSNHNRLGGVGGGYCIYFRAMGIIWYCTDTFTSNRIVLVAVASSWNRHLISVDLFLSQSDLYLCTLLVYLKNKM